MARRKLIETAMPVSVINRESEKEKSARRGLPRNVHLWWSRTPMATARSILFASCVDDPSEHPEVFPSKESQEQERRRLLGIMKTLCTVERSSDEEVLSEARQEMLRYSEGSLPGVFDPFVGGGTIPVESQRLGLESESSDLNTVAVIITKLVTDIPCRFGGTGPVHPQQELKMDIPSSGARGFAEDVEYYGKWMLEEAKERIGELYPQVTSPESGERLDVTAWIWARTVKCPNPTCSCEIPLSSSYDLARKRGHEAWVEPYAEEGRIRFRIHRNPNSTAKRKPKVARTAVFKCPVCGENTTDAYVKECGKRHRIQSKLIALVADEGRKRLYTEPTAEQEKIAAIQAPEDIPHGLLPLFPTRFSPPSFGLTDYADLFTNRQLVFITTMMQLAREVQDSVKEAAVEKGLPDDGISLSDNGRGALAYAEAVRMALVMTVSKLLDRCSNMCSWDSSGGGSLRSVFSRAAMPMIWDYAEGNPFSSGGGSFASALSRTCDVLATLPASGISNTVMRDATQQSDVREAILCTDLPYYDKASYGDLSDFFYVWLRYGIGDLFPEYFQTEVTPKEAELTAFPYRWGGDREEANAFYEEGLRLAMKNLSENVTEDYPSTVGFQYKGNDVRADDTMSEWEAFVTAVSDAGFTITASWPLGRKYESSVELAESRGIPITVVLRRRPQDAGQTTRRNFVAAVKRELPGIVDELRSMVDIMDLRSSVIGRALNIFTRNKKVLDADGSEMKPYMASRIIEQELDTILASVYEPVENIEGDKEE